MKMIIIGENHDLETIINKCVKNHQQSFNIILEKEKRLLTLDSTAEVMNYNP